MIDRSNQKAVLGVFSIFTTKFRGSLWVLVTDLADNVYIGRMILELFSNQFLEYFICSLDINKWIPNFTFFICSVTNLCINCFGLKAGGTTSLSALNYLSKRWSIYQAFQRTSSFLSSVNTSEGTLPFHFLPFLIITQLALHFCRLVPSERCLEVSYLGCLLKWILFFLAVTYSEIKGLFLSSSSMIWPNFRLF